MVRNFDINSAWMYFSSKFNSFLKRIHSHVSPKKKCTSLVKLKNKRNHLWKRYTRSQSHSDHLATLKLAVLYELLLITSAINLRDKLLITLRKIPRLSGTAQNENTSSDWKH